MLQIAAVRASAGQMTASSDRVPVTEAHRFAPVALGGARQAQTVPLPAGFQP